MSDPRIRPIQLQDVDAVVQLVHDLADYEKLPQLCFLTTDKLIACVFADSPAVYGHVAVVGNVVVGYALWFLNYSTWEGVHGIYLEDLYVSPAHRGSGLGKALLVNLASIAAERGYARVEWSVLDWNTPSIDFYSSLGAVPMQGWSVFRLTGQPLAQIAAGNS
ncbi:GNAT family N-acetyltransferase [Nakamurella antarctica]|uniref:GNAT family N-acetyltransferase n=1 Tax=Nakamurella antarctica TaxID=1902245 RepID=A0A3G8ZJQ8_9ACTN|nr:GNAT family N-acetyltransferase [Nakamurella antarctica]AZI57503.1 GNAT family N-acetyltransferase [Nakamurella antarctica]